MRWQRLAGLPISLVGWTKPTHIIYIYPDSTSRLKCWSFKSQFHITCPVLERMLLILVPLGPLVTAQVWPIGRSFSGSRWLLYSMQLSEPWGFRESPPSPWWMAEARQLDIGTTWNFYKATEVCLMKLASRILYINGCSGILVQCYSESWFLPQILSFKSFQIIFLFSPTEIVVA